MFLEPSIEILKKIRTKYKLTQKEVCYGIIDTSYLSHLESGRKKMNKETLELLINRYNLISSEKNLNFKLNKKILLLSVKEKRKIIFNNIYNRLELKHSSKNTLITYNNLSRYFTNEQNSIMLHKIIIKFYDNSNWQNCLSYSIKFFQVKADDNKYIKRLSQVILTFTVSVICNGQYQKINEIDFLINKEIYMFHEEIAEKILINTMNCFSRLNQPKKVFFYISIYNNIITTRRFRKEKEHLEALSLNKMKKYEESLKLYKNMLKNHLDIKTQITCNIDITYILKKQKKIKNIPYRYNIVKSLLKDNSSLLTLRELKSSYYFVGEIAILLNKKDDAIYYFKLLLELEEKEHLEGYNIDKYYHTINYLLTSTKKNDIPTIELLKRNILKFNKIEVSSSTISAFVAFLTKSKNTDILLDFLNELNKKS